MPEVPAHEKVLVDSSFLDDPNHGSLGCVGCHGGDPDAETRAEAHVEMSPDPTVGDGGVCADCHGDIAEFNANSLHTTLAGIRQSIAVRSGGGELPHELDQAFDNHCASCHSSCGNCHVSVPKSAGGGLLAKHQFKKTPPMTLVCTACHGSRVADEYKGNNEGVSADLHYFRGMQCADCHSGAEMHGVEAGDVTHRYDVAAAPKCGDCHPDDGAFNEVAAHSVHRDGDGQNLLSCQVCHSSTYKNCSSCHVSINDEDKAVYEVNPPNHESYMTFKIGLNPKRDDLHPAKWVPVRHVPIDPDNYAFYGDDLLTSFDARSTWRMATPHNVQRVTPQNDNCNDSCHGNRALFLSPDDLADYEIDANADVVVSDEEMP
ncbi:MAG: hypothetical protein ACQEXJ_00090 [Myxococcota bacterium]